MEYDPEELIGEEESNPCDPELAKAEQNRRMLFYRCKKSPGLFTDYLESVGGDVEKLLQKIAATPTGKKTKLAEILRILDEPGNSVIKNKWNRIIDSYKRAMILRAQRQAFNYIGSFGVRGSDPKDLSAFVAFSRFWLSSYNTTENAKAKAAVAASPPEGNYLSDILADLHAEDEDS